MPKALTGYDAANKTCQWMASCDPRLAWQVYSPDCFSMDQKSLERLSERNLYGRGHAENSSSNHEGRHARADVEWGQLHPPTAFLLFFTVDPWHPLVWGRAEM